MHRTVRAELPTPNPPLAARQTQNPRPAVLRAVLLIPTRSKSLNFMEEYLQWLEETIT